MIYPPLIIRWRMVLVDLIHVLADLNRLRYNFFPVIGAAVFTRWDIFLRSDPAVPPDPFGLSTVF